MIANNAMQSTTVNMGYEDSVYLAKLAEQAERYEGKLNKFQDNLWDHFC